VPVDAPFEDIVKAYERFWTVANPGPIGNVILAVQHMRPDLALRLVDRLGYDGAGVLFTSSLSARHIRQAPRETAESQARHLVEILELRGWRKPGSVPSPPLEPQQLAAARRLAEKARCMDPADWPGWSTSEQIVAALAADRLDQLPATYRDLGEAWARLGYNQRAAVREANSQMARSCKARADDTT
jgi:hypothetical protein